MHRIQRTDRIATEQLTKKEIPLKKFKHLNEQINDNCAMAF
jgi:hypothetical protein